VSFWENVTGVGVAPTTPGPQAYPQAPAPGYPNPSFQQPGYPQVPQAQPAGYPQQQTEEQQRIASSMAKAPSSRSTLTCPNCFSDNVCKPSANVMESCYTCGWNPRFEQSTAGAGLPSTAESGPARPARQISTSNNFNPQTIVATVAG
jgi:hypothetical protein